MGKHMILCSYSTIFEVRGAHCAALPSVRELNHYTTTEEDSLNPIKSRKTLTIPLPGSIILADSEDPLVGA